MAAPQMSRFAVLPDDVDDEYSSRKKRPLTKKAVTPKLSNSNNKADVNTSKKKKNKENSQAQSAKSKGKGGSNSLSNKKKKDPSPEQWEEWKEKDEKLVDGTYEEELSKAMLLSKLDYEEKKDVYEQAAKGAELEKKSNQKKSNRQIRVLSVEEFHNLGKPKKSEEPPEIIREEENPELLQRIRDEVKKEIAKENAVAKRGLVSERAPFDQEALSLAQVKNTLENKITELNELKEENAKLKDELLNVKMRNKQLFQIFANGEMKDKTEVLIEMDELKKVQEELFTEVKNLHEQLEQERSKVRQLTNDPKSKDGKNKKRTTSSGDQQ